MVMMMMMVMMMVMVMVRFMMRMRMMMRMMMMMMMMMLMLMLMLRWMFRTRRKIVMLRTKTDPKTRKHTLSEPVRWKRTWTFHKGHFAKEKKI